MNYRHIYHAGNFADVFKHCVLIAVLYSFSQKEKPFVYFDTHAGIGYYDLHKIVTKKTPEYKHGINTILHRESDNFIVQIYQQIIARCNAHTQSNTAINHILLNEVATIFSNIQNKVLCKNDDLRFYPGSPLIAKLLTRPCDKLILTELHQEDFLTLKANFLNISDNINIHHLNGYNGMKAFLPFKNIQNNVMRGLVFIDPPFENNNEFDEVFNALTIALKRYSAGTYVVWYPNKNILQINSFKKNLQTLVKSPVLFYDFNYSKILNLEKHNSLTQCGMAIINPPWQVEEYINPCVKWLQENLNFV